MADLEIFKGECKPPRACSEAAHSRGGAPPGNVCAPKVDFEASGTYFGSIGTSLANDAATLARSGVASDAAVHAARGWG